MGSKITAAVAKYDYIIIIAAFALSRFFVRAAGIEFESIAHRWCYQYLPPHFLKLGLVKSLWYLHMQPPFFNFFLGMGYKLFGDNDTIFFNVMFLSFSLLSILCFYACLKKIGMWPWMCLLGALLLLMSPSLVLFENILFYSVFVFFMLFVMLFALCCFSRSSHHASRFRFLCLFSSAALLLMLTRSLFHVAWFAGISLGFYILARRDNFVLLARKRFMIALAPALCIIVLLMFKNYFLFGVFQTSSWFGMNLSRITLRAVSQEQLEELYHAGKISEFSLRVKKNGGPFLPLDKYGMQPGTIETHKHPALIFHLNSLEYITISRQLAHDALEIIQADTAGYLKSLHAAIRLFFQPTTDGFIARSFDTQGIYYRFWNKIYYPFYSIALQVLAYACVVTVSGVYTAYALFSKKGFALCHKYTALFIFMTAVYFFIVANMFEFGENNRFRFEILPLILFGIPWSYAAILEIKSKTRGMRSETF